MGEFAVVPGEFTAVDDEAADGGAVTADELGERMQHNVGSVIDGTGDIGCGEGVVDHQRNAIFVSDIGDGCDVQDIAARVSDGFAVEQTRFGGDGAPEVLRVVGIDEGEVVAQAAQGDIELREGSAVERTGRNDVATGFGDGGHGQELSSLPARQGQRRHAVFKRSQARFQHVRSRVHYARVNVAELLQGEQARRVRRIVKGERCGLINGNGAGVRGRVGVVPCVQRACVEAKRTIEVFDGHKPLV